MRTTGRSPRGQREYASTLMICLPSENPEIYVYQVNAIMNRRRLQA
jgi:hypothetical protein